MAQIMFSTYPGYGVSHEFCVFRGAVENTERNSVSHPLDLMNNSLQERNSYYIIMHCNISDV